MAEQGLGATHLSDLRLAGLDIEYGWQVAAAKQRVANKKLGLSKLE